MWPKTQTPLTGFREGYLKANLGVMAVGSRSAHGLSVVGSEVTK